MDNNMNVVDFNNMPNDLNNRVNNQPEMNQQVNFQQPEVQPEPMVQQDPNAMNYQAQPSVQPQPVQPQVQPLNQNVEPFPNQNTTEQPIQNTPGEIPVINVNQTPTEVFGAPVNTPPVNNQVGPNPIIDIQPVEEKPKYGYVGSEHKADLNEGSNANITFIIILAVLMLAFIIALPYLSNLIG